MSLKLLNKTNVPDKLLKKVFNLFKEHITLFVPN